MKRRFLKPPQHFLKHNNHAIYKSVASNKSRKMHRNRSGYGHHKTLNTNLCACHVFLILSEEKNKFNDDIRLIYYNDFNIIIKTKRNSENTFVMGESLILHVKYRTKFYVPCQYRFDSNLKTFSNCVYKLISFIA